MTPGVALAGLAWLGVVGASLAMVRLAGTWRRGRAAAADWRAGLLDLPRRYLVDVHAVVVRRPEAATMHKLVAGGLLGGSALLLCGVVPGVAGLRLYWLAVAGLFAAGVVGTVLAAKRRWPSRPAHLSGGAFDWLPVWLAAYMGGGLIVAGAAAAALAGWAVAVPGLLLAAVGVAGLVAQLPRGPMRHALAGAVHLAAHPRAERFGDGVGATALRPIDVGAAVLGAGVAADFAWNRLASFDACISCGRCEQACPAFAAGQPLNPKWLIGDLTRAMRVSGPLVGVGVGADAAIDPDALWACTTCRACVEACPMLIEHVDAIVDMRRHQVLQVGAVPVKAVLPLHESRYADEPGGRALVARMDCLAGLDVAVLEEGGGTDVLLWLGDGAYDLRHGRTLRALVRLLRLAGVEFAVLGEAERDCGDLARRLGDEVTFQRLARENVATLGGRRFNRIVTADPHALHVLRNEYRAFGGDWTVLHHTGLLDALVTAGRLRPERVHVQPLAYHDPCYLARYNGEVAAPRRLLDRITTGRVEMARHGMTAMCCGGGGGAPISDVPIRSGAIGSGPVGSGPGRRRIPDLRMEQVREAGAAVVAVGCPNCTAMLEGVTGPRAEVRDVAELLLEAVEAGAAPAVPSLAFV